MIIDEHNSMCVPDEIDWHFERKFGIVDSIEELVENEDNMPDELVDYDSCENVLSNMMVDEFIEEHLSPSEKYILSCLLNGMTHKEISDTMDCTRQNISRCVERIGEKVIKFLSYR